MLIDKACSSRACFVSTGVAQFFPCGVAVGLSKCLPARVVALVGEIAPAYDRLKLPHVTPCAVVLVTVIQSGYRMELLTRMCIYFCFIWCYKLISYNNYESPTSQTIPLQCTTPNIKNTQYGEHWGNLINRFTFTYFKFWERWERKPIKKICCCTLKYKQVDLFVHSSYRNGQRE